MPLAFLQQMAPFVIDEIKLVELPNLPSTGVKPVGRCCLAFVFLIVAKPGFHRREVGWGAGRRVRPRWLHASGSQVWKLQIFRLDERAGDAPQ